MNFFYWNLIKRNKTNTYQCLTILIKVKENYFINHQLDQHNHKEEYHCL